MKTLPIPTKGKKHSVADYATGLMAIVVIGGSLALSGYALRIMLKTMQDALVTVLIVSVISMAVYVLFMAWDKFLKR